MKYDMHLATEAGDSTSLKTALAALGFKDDNLAARGLIFDPETAKQYSACPLIDVHASKKVPTHDELLKLEEEVDELMVMHDMTGYWHSEYVKKDEHIEPAGPFSLEPLPFARLESRPREKEKVWDIHLAMREDTVPETLKETLIAHGLYYLARLKKTTDGSEARFAVYTVQGVNRAKEGQRFYDELCGWLKRIGAPPCDIKLEITTAMKLYNSPRAVPPTIDHINWI